MTAISPSKRPGKTIPPHQRELLRAAELRQLLSLSRSEFYGVRSQLPVPIAIALPGTTGRRGRTVTAWRVREIKAWLEAGCPDPDKWKWRPTTVASVEQWLFKLYRDLEQVKVQIAQAELELAKGEKQILIERGF